MNLSGTTELEHPQEPTENPRSDMEVEHDLFNSVIDKDRARGASPRATASTYGSDAVDIEPAPGPSNTTPTRLRGHQSSNASSATSDHDSVGSADTVRGTGVKRSPKRKKVVDEDEIMDDGELADSESDVNTEEPLDKQMVGPSPRLCGAHLTHF